MINSNREFLFQLGWDDFFEKSVLGQDLQELTIAKVICEEKSLFRLQAEANKMFWSTVSGKMQFNSQNRLDLPAVGDWVLVKYSDQSDRGVIHQILPRKTTIYRKQIGDIIDAQILSTNVDYIFITSSANEDLNYRRFERYLAVAYQSEATPIVLLTKADLSKKPIDELVGQVQFEFPSVLVHAVSQANFSEADFFNQYLRSGSTAIFIGSSGVGKSTLINYLIGLDSDNENAIRTQEIREDDAKGKHTTTSRNLYISRFGGLVIDTPGMRELQLLDHSEGVSNQFAEVEEMIQHCRFSDCQHQTEPGCKILEALDNQTLSYEKWQSYQKLLAEARFAERKYSKVLASQDKRMWKKRTIEATERGKNKKGGGYY